MKGKKVVITGGAGFIGSHIAAELVKQNADVVVIDNLCEGKRENFSEIINKIKFVEGDIRDFDLLLKEFKDIDYISHQAALRSVPGSLEKPELYNEVNVQGHYNVLEAARRNNVKRVVFAASSSAYGDNPNLPLKEEFLPQPISPYAVTKVLGENYCRMFYKLFGLKTISLRYFNVMGPKQNPNSQYAGVIPFFIKKMLNNEQPTIFGDGLQTRDFTFVQNNVEANIAAFKTNNEKAFGETINIACGNPISINELVLKINKLLNKNIKSKYLPPRKGDVLHIKGDITKAQELLNYKLKYDFDYGLQKVIEWMKN